MEIGRFKQVPVIGILRGIRADILEPLVETVVSSGLRTIEITMNTPGAPELIRQMREFSKGDLALGAGTVLTMDELRSALDCGATFIVMPTFIDDVVDYCVKRSIPVFPGALTPGEIYRAWSAGAAMVKVFPARYFGAGYLKEIKGPFGNIELLACGGVNADNVRSFFSCGASAVAFGASIFKPEWLDAGEFSLIEKSIKALIAAIPKKE